MKQREYQAKVKKNYKARKAVEDKLARLRIRLRPLVYRMQVIEGQIVSYAGKLDMLKQQSHDLEHEADRELE